MSLEMYMFLLLLVATCLMLFVSYLSFRKRQLAVAKYSALVMLTASFYSLGYAFEVVSTDPDGARFWLKIQYIGIPFISTFWLLLVIFYTGHQAVLKRWVMLLLIIPTLTLVLHYTNDVHHLYYKDIQYDFNTSHLSPIILFRGPWYWVHISYSYLQATLGMILFVVMYLKAVPLVRKQVVLMMLGAAAPWVSNAMYLAYQGNDFDMTPLGFTLSGLIYLWGIYRFNLLRLVPVALQTVFETMQDGVIILDYDNNITHVNEAAKYIFQELNPIQDNLNSIYDVFSTNQDLLSKLDHSESQISIRRLEEIRYYNVKISVIRDRAQHTLGKLLIFSDMTQVTEYQDKLLLSANRLAELNAFKDKLFTVVTHDIRDPLALLVNLTEIIEEDFVDTGSEEFNVFREVSNQVRDTYMLVENLLDWFRSQRGKISFSPLVWDLATIVQQALFAKRARSELKKIQITSSVHEGMLVFADKGMIDLILSNLLSNALKFTEIGGHVHIDATNIRGQVTVSVRDSGVGVGLEVGKTLFDEVQQGSSTGTDGEKGSGLGLYLCRKFVQLNGGNIWFESNPDHGSTFLFTLPKEDTASTQLRTAKELDAR